MKNYIEPRAVLVTFDFMDEMMDTIETSIGGGEHGGIQETRQQDLGNTSIWGIDDDL